MTVILRYFSEFRYKKQIQIKIYSAKFVDKTRQMHGAHCVKFHVRYLISWWVLVNAFTSLLHTFAIAMQYTLFKKSFSLTLLMQNLWLRLQNQLSEACLPQCRVETESPISPDPSLFCTGSWFFLLQCASNDGKCCSLLSTLHYFTTQQYYYGRPDAGILFSSCGFFFLFLPRVISAVADWMSTILPHMVWP